MNETITIKEGNITRRLAPIDKLKVNTTDNKDSMWVSTGKANTGVLHASENGIYIASEDGYEAYSEVIVRVTKDSFDGDTSFNDWDYETPDMDLSNWDPETIEDFELDPDGFNDIFNNEDEWKDIDKPIDIKMDNPKIQDTKISGIDPVTGNEMEVGLDENGYLTESILPSSIKIITLPNKHQYVEGQKIDLRGIVVQAYTEDGNVWVNDSYPDGIIPIEELTFEPSNAIYDGSEGKYVISDLFPDGVPISSDPIIPTVKPKYGPYVISPIYSTNASAYYISGNYIMCLYATDIESNQYTFEYRSVHWDSKGEKEYTTNTTTISLSHYTYNDKTVYYAFYPSCATSLNGYNPEFEIEASGIDLSQLSSMELTQYAWTIVYGDKVDKKSEMSVNVSWTRSDGEVLTDSFIIEVLPDPDGAHPQVDPSTVEWNHRRYKANEELGAVEVRNGRVYMAGGAIYDAGAAVRLGMLEPVDNEIVP